jgi:hypothetical protein
MPRLLAALALIASFAGCAEGPGERAGKSLDKVGEKVRDTVDPPRGASERVGRAVDRAVN